MNAGGSRAMSVEPEPQRCAACGMPGQPPKIGEPKPNDLTVKPFLGRLELICRDCQTVAARERIIRRPKS
jgi:hypothetical protein